MSEDKEPRGDVLRIPLDPDEAVSDLLRVPPPPDKKRRAGRKPKATQTEKPSR